MGCLDDVEVLELVSGVMPAAELSRADAHLDGCEDCRLLVASVVRARRGPDLVEPAPGDHIGRFVIEERRASGAMGVVFTATDPELGRRVAIKVLRPELAGSEARGRLLREAQAMAKVADPNVVAVFEVGTVGERVFVAMELVDGVTLRAWLASERRSTAAILEVFRQAGQGLAAAHRAGLVHRDFKPDNVLVASDGRVRVTDFGLASAPLALASEPAAEEASDDLVHTRTGALLGTPAYMAPEQLAGAAADARSDQFGFAVALFEALHGERPFAGSNVAELEAAIRARITRPDKARLPGDLSAAVRKALAPEPDQRHRDMAALLAAVSPARRSVAGWAIALGAMVCVGLGVAAFFFLRQPAKPPVCNAYRDFDAYWTPEKRGEIERAFGDAAPGFGPAAAKDVTASIDRWRSELEASVDTACATATRSREDQRVALAQASCVELSLVEVRTLIESLPALDRDGVARAGELVSGSLPNVAACRDPSLREEAPAGAARQEAFLAREALARSHAALTIGNFAKAQQEAEQAVRAAQASGHLPTVGVALLGAAEAARATGAADKAVDLARESLFASEEGHDDRGVARAWILMMSIEGGRGSYDRALEWVGFARAALARAGKPATVEADLEETLANLLLADGSLEDAGATLERAWKLMQMLHEEEGLRGARLRTLSGNLLRAQGDFARALDQHRAGLALDEQRLGANHPLLARHHHNIAGLLKAQGKIDEAVVEYERALALAREGFGNDHPEVARTLNSLGIVAVERGETEKARALYKDAIRIYALTGHEQRAVVEKNLAALEEPAPPTSSSASSSRFSSAAPRPSAAPKQTATPTATAKRTSEPGSYMPAPAWP